MKLCVSFCVFIWTTAIYAQTFTNNQIQAIAESVLHEPTVVQFTVSGLPNTMDQSFGVASVCLNISHPDLNNLTIKLVAPDGTKVTLFHQLGNNDDDLINTCFEGEGPPIYLQNAPFTGSFRSTLPLGQVNNGQDPNGNWYLWIYDDQSSQGTSGTFLNASIHFSNQPAVPFNFDQSNLPIIEISTQTQVINNYTKAQVQFKTYDHVSGMNHFKIDAPIYNAYALLEWQGWSSVGSPKKNFDIDLVDSSGLRVDAALLSMPAENDWVLKGEYTDRTLIKNNLVFDLYEKMGHYAPRTRLCEVVLDGEYIGVYTLQEKVKRNAERVKVQALTPDELSYPSISGAYIFEMNPIGANPDWFSAFPPINDATTNYDVEFKMIYPKRSSIPMQQLNYLKAFTDSMELALLAPTFQDSLLGYRAFIDVYSFIDFMLLAEFAANYDTYARSFYLVKEPKNDGNKIKVGPPWDFDRTFGYDWPSPQGWVWQITNYYWPFPFWWSKFWSDEQYRKEAECRWKSYRTDALSDAAIQQVLDSLETRIAVAVTRNDFVWKDQNNLSYSSYRDTLHSWISQRLNWIDDSLNQYNVFLPSISTLADTSICAGDTLDFNLSGQYRYDWDPGPKTPLLAPTESGFYTLIVTDVSGCFTKQTIYVDARKPNVDFTLNLINGTHQIECTAVDPSLPLYAWSVDADTTMGTPVFPYMFTSNGCYSITLNSSDTTGCSWSESQVHCVNSFNTGAIGFSVYPNPSDTQIYLIIQESLVGKTYQISDAMGKIVAKGDVDSTQIILETPWDCGLYFIIIGGRVLPMVKR